MPLPRAPAAEPDRVAFVISKPTIFASPRDVDFSPYAPAWLPIARELFPQLRAIAPIAELATPFDKELAPIALEPVPKDCVIIPIARLAFPIEAVFT